LLGRDIFRVGDLEATSDLYGISSAKAAPNRIVLFKRSEHFPDHDQQGNAND
jgi:hypothetical protein